MFASLSLSDLPTSSKYGYAAALPAFKGKRRLSFKPGLNILFAPNGSGKSTILKILGDSMCATQGGVSAITEGLVHESVDMFAKPMRDKLGVRVVHDGQPVMFCDPRATVGLSGGAFDDDFFQEGLKEVTHLNRRSHGQACVSRLSGVLAVLGGQASFPEKVLRKISKQHVNDIWGCALDVMEARLSPGCPPGPPSILLDEPEANLSLVLAGRLWSRLSQPSVADKFQIIVATHSPFALGIAHAHYIDLQKGFRQESQSLLEDRFRVRGKKT